MCHGARGISQSNIPSLAGQYREAVIKQLQDFKGGDRAHPAMALLALRRSEDDISALASFYPSPDPLPHPLEARGTAAPRAGGVGAPLDNIAPGGAGHGTVDHKLGGPRLEGLPREYLARQLQDFQTGARHNDAHAQMRNMARAMTRAEIADAADFYALSTGE